MYFCKIEVTVVVKKKSKDDSVGKAFLTQAWEPNFDSQYPHKCQAGMLA